MVTSLSCKASKSLSASFARSRVIGWPVNLEFAMVFLYNAQGLETYRADRVGNFSGTVENATLLKPEILFKL